MAYNGFNTLGSLSGMAQQSPYTSPAMQQQMQQAQSNYINSIQAQSAYNSQASSTTATNFYIGNTTSTAVTTWAAFSPTDHYGVREPTEGEKLAWAEQLLAHKLHAERKMLVEHKRVAALPRVWWPPNDNTPIPFPTNVHVTEGYVLQADKTYVLPDGSTIRVDEHGNYGIEDCEAKVIYRANKVREFNRFINASDQLERFIKDAHRLVGVDQAEVLQLPVEAFINWLVLQAAQQDGDRTDHLPKVEDGIKPKALPAPDEVYEEVDLRSDCIVIKEVYVKRIPRSAIEDGQLTLRKPVVSSPHENRIRP